jgi:serine/threonine protein kinase
MQIQHFCEVVVDDWLGSGSFGQVFKVYNVADPTAVYALKVTRDEYRSGVESMAMEVRAYRHIELYFSDEGRAGCGRAYGRSRYLCEDGRCLRIMLMDHYPQSLFSYLEDRGFVGLSLTDIRLFLRGILYPLRDMAAQEMIHGDLKPENIMMTDRGGRLIDFGGASFKSTGYRTNIQTRWYRSPEVILGQEPTPAIDTWSIGAILAEMAVGLPIFAGSDELHVLQLIELRLGPFPETLLSRSTSARLYFDNSKVRNQAGFVEDPADLPGALEALIPRQEDVGEQLRDHFLRLLRKMLAVDPEERITAREVFDHPYVLWESQ